MKFHYSPTKIEQIPSKEGGDQIKFNHEERYLELYLNCPTMYTEIAD